MTDQSPVVKTLRKSLDLVSKFAKLPFSSRSAVKSRNRKEHNDDGDETRRLIDGKRRVERDCGAKVYGVGASKKRSDPITLRSFPFTVKLHDDLAVFYIPLGTVDTAKLLVDTGTEWNLIRLDVLDREVTVANTVVRRIRDVGDGIPGTCKPFLKRNDRMEKGETITVRTVTEIVVPVRLSESPLRPRTAALLYARNEHVYECWKVLRELNETNVKLGELMNAQEYPKPSGKNDNDEDNCVGSAGSSRETVTNKSAHALSERNNRDGVLDSGDRMGNGKTAAGSMRTATETIVPVRSSNALFRLQTNALLYAQNKRVYEFRKVLRELNETIVKLSAISGNSSRETTTNGNGKTASAAAAAAMRTPTETIVPVRLSNALLRPQILHYAQNERVNECRKVLRELNETIVKLGKLVDVHEFPSDKNDNCPDHCAGSESSSREMAMNKPACDSSERNNRVGNGETAAITASVAAPKEPSDKRGNDAEDCAESGSSGEETANELAWVLSEDEIRTIASKFVKSRRYLPNDGYCGVHSLVEILRRERIVVTGRRVKTLLALTDFERPVWLETEDLVAVVNSFDFNLIVLLRATSTASDLYTALAYYKPGRKFLCVFYEQNHWTPGVWSDKKITNVSHVIAIDQFPTLESRQRVLQARYAVGDI